MHNTLEILPELEERLDIKNRGRHVAAAL